MTKRLSAIAAFLLLCLPAAAAAEDKVEPRVQALLACESIGSGEARLQCYDQSILALKQALAHGTMVVKEKKGPTGLEGVVQASGKSGENRYWVILDNGDRWELNTVKARRQAPPPGTRLKLKRTPFRNYWISGPGWPESEAAFLGRGS